MGYDSLFSKDSYIELIESFRHSGYDISRFDQKLSDSLILTIRHDIDIDVDSAIEMAELEHKHNIVSTYFVSMRSPFYNPFSVSNIAKIKRIHECGHDMGAHISINFDHRDPFDDIVFLKQHFSFLRTDIATLHHPGTMENVKSMLHVPAINSVYKHIFEGTVGYITDSTGRWRYGHPLQSETYRLRRSLVLLTHPIWWIEPGDTPHEKLMNHLLKNKTNFAEIENFLPSFYKANYE